LLALEIRSRKAGFAVFEGATGLLDWGVRWFEIKNQPLKAAVSKRIGALLSLHRPSVVVARRQNYYSARSKRRFGTILRSIRAETKWHSARFALLPPRKVQRQFAWRAHTTKHEVAVGLAERFPELAWKLPRPKKFYQSEASTMVIFDAVATGAAFLGRKASGNGIVQPVP